MGKVAASVTSRRRGCNEASVVYANPSVKPSVCQLPVRGAFWRGISSNTKPALKGEVDASVTSRRRGCNEASVVYVNPSVNPPYGVLPAPRKGAPFGTVQTQTLSLPSKGRWLRVQRADGGVATRLLLFTSTPQSIRLTAYCQLPGRGAFFDNNKKA